MVLDPRSQNNTTTNTYHKLSEIVKAFYAKNCQTGIKKLQIRNLKKQKVK